MTHTCWKTEDDSVDWRSTHVRVRSEVSRDVELVVVAVVDLDVAVVDADAPVVVVDAAVVVVDAPVVVANSNCWFKFLREMLDGLCTTGSGAFWLVAARGESVLKRESRRDLERRLWDLKTTS